MKPTRKLSRRSFLGRVAGGAIVGGAALTVLGESARHPRFLRTIHRHGYAFQGVAQEISDSSRTDTAGEPASHAAVGHWLITVSGQVPLLPGDNIIGRDPNARVWLNAASVSRHR